MNGAHAFAPPSLSVVAVTTPQFMPGILRWSEFREQLKRRLGRRELFRLASAREFSERDRQDDGVGPECILQRPGDDRRSNRPSLRRQLLGGPATRNGHANVFTGERVG
jgi:hypothetical protein